MFAKILITLAVIVAIILGVAALQPADFRIERSISISAPPEAAFAYLNDLHKWQEMSPYMKLDPAAKYTFSGPAAGVGAAVEWVGNSKVGEGRMDIIESRPNELVLMKLEFIKPFAATSTAEFKLTPTDGKTTVTWGMFGKNNFMAKVMCLFMNMDKMVGSDFETGLATLKTLAESQTRK